MNVGILKPFGYEEWLSRGEDNEAMTTIVPLVNSNKISGQALHLCNKSET